MPKNTFLPKYLLFCFLHYIDTFLNLMLNFELKLLLKILT
jgi:hypothetical protein